MLFKIPFLSWTGKAALEIEITDATEGRLRMRAALTIAVKKRADLSGAVLRSAVLSGADLRSAVLSGADLRSAVLSGADLRSADLSGAVLRSAVLSGADLRSAVLSGADLRSAVLSGADLRSAVLPVFTICPEAGSFTAFKKLRNGLIATIEIPAEAQRVSQPRSRKCRAEFVKVLAIHDDEDEVNEGVSQHDNTTVYRVGEIVKPDSYNDDIREECTNGIHFFITKREAEDY